MASFTDKVKAQVDKVLHPGEHKDTTATGSTATGASHTGHSHTGHSHTGAGVGTGVGAGVGTGTGVGSSTAGPHSSNLANKADPRVDSNLDGSRNFGAAGAGTGGYGASTGTGYNDSHSTNLGPHSSNTANKLDPRVDSDGDRGTGLTGGLGASGHQTGSSYTGSSLTGASGIGSTGHHAGGGIGATSHTGIGSSGHTGVGSSGHTGMGSSGHTGTGVGGGPGPAPNTAGPHSSDMLNKVDPRVDSNMDGSKTVGGNPTY